MIDFQSLMYKSLTGNKQVLVINDCYDFSDEELGIISEHVAGVFVKIDLIYNINNIDWFQRFIDTGVYIQLSAFFENDTEAFLDTIHILLTRFDFGVNIPKVKVMVYKRDIEVDMHKMFMLLDFVFNKYNHIINIDLYEDDFAEYIDEAYNVGLIKDVCC